MTKRRATVAVGAMALALAIAPATVSAGGPIGGCPDEAGWHLVYPIHQPQAADHNGDGWLCRRDLASGQGGAFGLGFTFFDNVLPIR